ncbi:hypothetical protein ACRRTK_003471 [Alexandromys fortis]
MTAGSNSRRQHPLFKDCPHAIWQGTAHASTTGKVHDVQTGQAGHKKKDCKPCQDRLLDCCCSLLVQKTEI